MSALIPESELRKKAIAFVAEHLREGKYNLSSLIDQAGQRFNLAPKDTEFLIRFFKEHKPDKDNS